MAKIVHTMLSVLDEERSVGFYRKTFGLEVGNRKNLDSFTFVYLLNDENDVGVRPRYLESVCFRRQSIHNRGCGKSDLDDCSDGVSPSLSVAWEMSRGAL